MLKKYVSFFMVLVFLLTNIPLNFGTMTYSSASINSDVEHTPNSSHALPTPDSTSTPNTNNITVNESLPSPTPTPANYTKTSDSLHLLNDTEGTSITTEDNIVFLSDLNWYRASCGWRTIQRDKSVENNIITLNGITYSKGIGTHAYSEIIYFLGSNCTTFVSDIGIDDECDNYGGSVAFQVWADGTLLYDSGIMYNTTPTKAISVNVSGVNELKLIVTNADGKNYCDHADWAGARLEYLHLPLSNEVFLSDLDYLSASCGWGSVSKDKSVGNNIITLNGMTYPKGIGTHAESEIIYNLGGNYSAFLSDIGVDDECTNYGSVVFQVWADGTLLYDSGVMYNSTPTKTVNVDVSGKNELKLIVTNANGSINSDHADWAGAELIPSLVDTWYKFTLNDQVIYVNEPKSGDSSIEARVCSIGSLNAFTYSYDGTAWMNTNIIAGIPGDGGIIVSGTNGLANHSKEDSIRNIGISSVSITRIIDATSKVTEFLSHFAFLTEAKTEEDWKMINLGANAALIDSVYSRNAVLLNNRVMKALLFFVNGESEQHANSNYFYISAKTNIEYAIMIAARIVEKGSEAAAAAALVNAGVSFSGGIYTFVYSGGIGGPITFALGAEATSSLALAGVCTIAGVAVGVVAENAEAAFKNDISNPSLNKAVAEAIESANALAKQYGGRNIVGTTFNEIKPTQEFVNWEKVEQYVQRLNAGEQLPAIDVYQVAGKEGWFIEEGHHRLIASKITGKPVSINYKTTSGPAGMSDWTEVMWKEYTGEGDW